jgi:hypothetical protein
MLKHRRSGTASGIQDRPATPYWAWAGLGTVLVLGLALRLRTLGQECPWYDEIISLRHLNTASLRSFLRQVRELNEPVPPLYFVVEYYLTRFTAHPVLALRLLSVGFSMATMVALYGLTARLFSPLAGLLAAFFLAINSEQIYHSQEIRMYAMTGLLSVLSFRAFVSVLRTESRSTQRLNAGLNLLLVWTQPTSLLIPFLQGLHLLVFRPHRWRVYRPWFFLNGLAALSILTWSTTRNTERLAEQLGWLKAPDLGFSNECALGTFYLAVMGADGTRFRTSVGLLVAAAVLLAWKTLAREHAPLSNAGIGAREVGALVLSWLFLPAVMLFAASYLWRPCFLERYFLFSFFPAYMVLGALVTYLKTPRTKALGAAVLLAFMSLGLLSLPEGPYRVSTDKITQAIRAEAKPGDVLLLTSTQFTFRYEMKYYLQRGGLDWEAANEPEEVLATILRCLQQREDVWVVAKDRGWRQQFERMEYFVEQAGGKLAYETWPGKHPALMVHVSAPPTLTAKN